jgi:hypothetical protein
MIENALCVRVKRCHILNTHLHAVEASVEALHGKEFGVCALFFDAIFCKDENAFSIADG